MTEVHVFYVFYVTKSFNPRFMQNTKLVVSYQICAPDHRQTDVQAERRTDRRADTEAGRHTERQAYRQTDRTDRQSVCVYRDV